MSLWLQLVGQWFDTVFGFLAVFLLFQRFDSVAGWSFGEVAVCFGVAQIAYSAGESVGRGFDLFSRTVSKGDFDRILLRPRGTAFQVLCSSFQLTRLGALVQGVVVVSIAVPRLDTVWTASKVLTLCGMVAGGTCVFVGIFILGATVCFFTVEGLEILNIFSYGGREAASYPLTIYTTWMARLFTFVIPLGCMNYLPLLYITGRAERFPVLYMLSPLLGVLFLVPCLLAWTIGVSRYKSTGS